MIISNHEFCSLYFQGLAQVLIFLSFFVRLSKQARRGNATYHIARKFLQFDSMCLSMELMVGVVIHMSVIFHVPFLGMRQQLLLLCLTFISKKNDMVKINKSGLGTRLILPVMNFAAFNRIYVHVYSVSIYFCWCNKPLI